MSIKYKEESMSLSELTRNSEAIVEKLTGDERFMSRITSIGLTPGCSIKVIRNDKNRPMLIYSRDTLIALNRKECLGIEVTEVAV
jgi:ferrous iron transport protein A